MRPILPILALLLAGCASRTHVPLATSYAPSADGTRTSGRRSALLDVTTIWPLPPLDSVALPAGSRELRIADWYSMILGRPVPVLRLVEEHGGARGEILHVWFEGRDWPRRYTADRCWPWHQDGRMCGRVAALPDSVAATATATFERLGAWEITARCEDGSHITDSGALILERLAGDRFGRYECNAPGRRHGTEAGERAAQLYGFFRFLVAESGDTRRKW